MPKRKFSSYRRRKPTFRKKRKVTYRKRKIIRRLPLTGFPKSKLVRMRYVQSVILNPDAVAPVIYEWRANSIYDPDYTSAVVGHQPRGHDQWALVYRHYNVLGSKFTVRCNPSTSTTTVPGMWGVALNNTPGEFGTLTRDQILECKNGRFYSAKSMGGDASFGRLPNMCTVKFSAKKYFGLKRGTVAAFDANRSPMNANPVETAIFTLWAGHTASNDPNPQEYTVCIDYICLLTEPITLDES